MGRIKAKSVDTRESVRVVTKNSFITLGGVPELSLKARKLLYIALAQAKKTDKKFYTFVITPMEFAELMNISVSHIYEEAENITDELMKMYVRYEQDGHIKKISVFDICEYSKYETNDITFRVSGGMSEFLLNLQSDFSKPLLLDFMQMRSPYSMAIWHLMQREMKSKKPMITDCIEFDLSLAELRQVTGTETKLPQLVNFKERALDKAIREIHDLANVDVTYTDIKKGRTVTGFHFEARAKYGFDISELDPDYVEAVQSRAEATRRKAGLI